MSTCERCGVNPCDCCEHAKPPGECVKCVDEVNDMLIDRIQRLEARLEAVEKRRVDVTLRERVEVLEATLRAMVPPQ